MSFLVLSSFILVANAAEPALCSCNGLAANYPGVALVMANAEGSKVDRFFTATKFDQERPTEKGMEGAVAECLQYKITLIQMGACTPY